MNIKYFISIVISVLFVFQLCAQPNNGAFKLTDTLLHQQTCLTAYSVGYKIGRSELDTTHVQFLDSLTDFLNKWKNISIEIGVHSDSRTCASEMKMSRHLFRERAISITDYLIKKGINSDRLIPIGYGCKYLVISDAEIKKQTDKKTIEQLHRINRRTTIVIKKLN